jgi:hypothetical protein
VVYTQGNAFVRNLTSIGNIAFYTGALAANGADIADSYFESNRVSLFGVVAVNNATVARTTFRFNSGAYGTLSATNLNASDVVFELNNMLQGGAIYLKNRVSLSIFSFC